MDFRRRAVGRRLAADRGLAAADCQRGLSARTGQSAAELRRVGAAPAGSAELDGKCLARDPE